MTLPRPMLAAGTDTQSRCRIAAQRRRVFLWKSLWQALVVRLGREETKGVREQCAGVQAGWSREAGHQAIPQVNAHRISFALHSCTIVHYT